MKKNSFIKILGLVLFITLSLMICGCDNTQGDDQVSEEQNDPIEEEYVETNTCPYCHKCIDETCEKCSEKCTCEPVEVNRSESKLLEGTDYETPIYTYTTNKEGPKIAIVGGIHGDELAGWSAALRMVDSLLTERGIRGTIMLIPKVNILADNARNRYKVSGHSFSDLNRSFPLDRYSTATAETIQISDAIVSCIETFDPDYIIDLHESKHSWTEMESGTYTSLGDTLIASNSPRWMRELVKYYNETYRLEDETEFRVESSNQKGSFNYYFTNTYPDKIVFTVETNRNEDKGVLANRIRQQLNILQALYDIVWERN